MYMKSSICGIQHTCINFFFIFLIITKIECWPVFKQDPLGQLNTRVLFMNSYALSNKHQSLLRRTIQQKGWKE